jgi:regulator of sigma E protease
VLFNAVVPGLLLLGLVILVHELGHFLAAKWRGVQVLRFSIGFGPPLFQVTRGETEYRLSWFPLGGYVQMAGDSPDAEGAMPGGPREFLSHVWYGRLLISAAGPAANLVTAFVVLVLVGLTGVSYPDFPNIVGAVPDTSVAHHWGIRAGDRIVAVNGAPVASWIKIFVTQSKTPASRPVDLRIVRGDDSWQLHLPADQREPFFSSLRRPLDPAVVGTVITGMPAYKAGIKEGDRILAVNGRPVGAWSELPEALRGTVDQPVRLRIARGGQQFDVTVVPIDPDGRGTENARIGIEAPRQGTYVERHGLVESLRWGVGATGSMVSTVYGGMWMTALRPLYYKDYVGGPLLIAQAASEQARRGVDSYLQFLALINVAIMAFNLLPLPILDGGHILLALFEALRRQAISARTYIRFQKVGLVVMGTLLLVILANDPLRLIQRQQALHQGPPSAPREQPVAPP